MWSDPDDIAGWALSPRGAGFLFGYMATNEVRTNALFYPPTTVWFGSSLPCIQYRVCANECVRRVVYLPDIFSVRAQQWNRAGLPRSPARHGGTDGTFFLEMSCELDILLCGRGTSTTSLRKISSPCGRRRITAIDVVSNALYPLLHTYILHIHTYTVSYSTYLAWMILSVCVLCYWMH